MSSNDANSGDSEFEESCSHQDPEYLSAIFEFEKALDNGQSVSIDDLAARYPRIRNRLEAYVLQRQMFGEFTGRRQKPEFVKIQDFSHYKIGDVVKYGGNAAIYLVEDSRFERTSAFKLPLKEAAQSATSLRQLQREAKISGRLQHPHIVPVYDTGNVETSEGPLPFLTMPFVDGGTLADRLRARSSISTNQFEFILLFQQICQAVSYVHRLGIVHRDLKPENIMVGNYNDAYVMDWGFAIPAGTEFLTTSIGFSLCDQMIQQLQETPVDPEKTMIVADEAEGRPGTPAYFPPEFAQATTPCADSRQDVFCLGGILCAILTGAPPFLGDGMAALMLSRSGDMQDTFSRLNSSGAASELVTLAINCLSADPLKRPADGSAVLSEVTQYIEKQEQAKIEAERQAALEARRRADAESIGRINAEKLVHSERRAKWLTAGLGMSLLFGLLTFAGFQWRTTRIQQKLEESHQDSDIESALSQMFNAIDSSNFVASEQNLQRAKGRLGTSTRLELVDRVIHAEKLLKAATQLNSLREEVAVVRSDPNRPSFDYLLQKFTEAFEMGGISPIEDEAVKKINLSPIKSHLLNGIDLLASITKNQDDKLHLWKLASTVEGQSELVKSIREARLAEDMPRWYSIIDSIKPEETTLPVVQFAVTLLPDDDPKALKLLKSVEKLGMGDFWLQYEMATRLLNKASRLKTPQSYQTALSYARAASAIRPKSLGALFVLGRLFFEVNDNSHLNDVAELLSSHDGAEWIKQRILGWKAYRAERFEDAIAHFESSLKLGPYSDDARIWIAGCYGSLEKYDECLRLCEEILLRKPNDPEAWSIKLIAMSSMHRNDSKKVFDVVVERCRSFPDDEAAIESLGFLLMSHGRYIEGEICLKRIKQPELLSSEKRLESLLPAIYSGDWEPLLREMSSSRMDIGSWGLVMEGMINAWLGRYDEAKSTYKYAAEAESSHGGFREKDGSGLLIAGGILLMQSQINQMIAIESKYPLSTEIPHWDQMKKPLFQSQASLQGDYFQSKGAHVLATQAYEHAFRNSLKSRPRSTSAIGFGSDRIRAASSAAQASYGGGLDALRADDKTRARFRSLSFEWISDEVRLCRQILSRKDIPGLMQLFVDSGDREMAVQSLSILMMYRKLDPVRDPKVINDMPEEDRKIARKIWRDVVDLYEKECPPIDLPIFEDQNLSARLGLDRGTE